MLKIKMKLNYPLYVVIITAFQGTVIHSAHKTKLLSIKDCEHPSPPKCLPNMVDAKFVTYPKNDGNLLNGSIDVKNNIIPFLSFRPGFEANRKLKNYKLYNTKLSCKNIFSKFILTSTNISYNYDTCEIIKGNYQFEAVDVNKIDHAMNFVPIREPGINIWYAAWYGDNCTYICIIIRIEIILLKKNARQTI